MGVVGGGWGGGGGGVVAMVRASVIQISWHDTLPVLSIDLDPQTAAEDGLLRDSSKRRRIDGGGGGGGGGVASSGPPYRVATAGLDKAVRIWSLPRSDQLPIDGPPVPEFRASLEHHSKPVNCVRFRPGSGVDGSSALASGGDDGQILLWILDDAGPESSAASSSAAVAPSIPAPSLPAPSSALSMTVAATAGGGEENPAKESWRVARMWRCPEDVVDLAWSPCGRYLASASTDNVLRVWDTVSPSTRVPIAELSDHGKLVQGVAWDPRGELLASQGSDRTVWVYRMDSFQSPSGGRAAGYGS